jgi:predicted RNA-binding protein YlqC (UPF0109 family)
METMVHLVREVVTALVDDPGEVTVSARDGVVYVKVARGDVGKVIGKQGRTARSLRTILSAAAMKTKMHCDLSIHQYEHDEVMP